MNDPSTDAANATIRIAAIGDLHVREDSERSYRAMFEEISEVADVLVLAGDLTDFGKSDEAEKLAEDLRACTIPSVGVLGNHDYESGQPERVVEILRQAGLRLLDDQATVIEGVGFAGVKGFLGGFDRGELGAFGEQAVKLFVDEALNEARKLENQLRTLRTDRTVAILHYAPIAQTVEGEPLQIFPFLGSSRLADAIDRFENVKAVFHGHAHRGSFRGDTPKGIPVYNVAQFVVQEAEGRPYTLVEV
jgi:Icc-related predicted phosphoesterase